VKTWIVFSQLLATWKTVVERIGEWPKDRIATFANDRHICFRSAWFLHDSPLLFIGSQRLPEDLRDVLQINDLRRVIGAIESGIATDADKWHPDLDANYDWGAAKTRVANIIAGLRAQHVPPCDCTGNSNHET